MIALFNQILPSSNLLTGGEFIVAQIMKNDYPLTVILPSRKAWLVMKELRANYHFTPVLNSNNNFTNFINWVWLAIASLRFKYDDDITTSGDFFCNTIPAFVKKKWGRKWTAYIFHINPKKRFFSYLLQQFSILLMYRADLIVVLNPLVRDYLINRGFKKVFIQEVDVDKRAIDAVKEKTKVYEACFMGRLSPSKGIFDLPKIWEGMQGKLIVMGNGFPKDVEKLKKLCGENIIFVGDKQDEEKIRLIKQSKVFIFPSYEEGLSLTIKEVLACGVPIVAWDLPVYKVLYKNKLKLVPIGDIEAFRRAICEYL